MRNIILAIIVGILLYEFAGPVIAPKKPEIIVKPEVKELSFVEILDTIKAEDVKKYVEDLSSKDFEGRGTGTEGNKKAAQYICDHLDKLKIPYQRQTFTARGSSTDNIIASLIPKNSKNNNIIVIGAHFDHLGSRGSTYYPGADDNASGTAGLMAIATALSHYKDKLQHTVSLQFYSAEELGLIGSDYYTDHPMLPVDGPDIKKHIAMINLDMIGYLKSGYSDSENTTTYRNTDEFTESYSSIDLKSIVNDLSSKYSFSNNISGYRPGGSDHGPFYKKGIPVVFLHTGLHSNYHKPSDTSEKLNYNGLALVSKLAFEILIKIDTLP